MLKWFLRFCATIFILFPYPAAAQVPLALERLEVDIMPEYDRPEVLIIYHLFLPESTVFPAIVTLRIPATVGNPYNVAVRDADGLLYNVDYTRTVEGGWALVSFSSSTNEAQVEYYDPGMIKDGPNRSFTYQWPADYAVSSLVVQVQQPFQATGMQITPSLGEGLPGEDGLTYYQAIVGSILPGSPYSLTIQYQKESDELSVQNLKVEPAGPISAQTPGRTNPATYLPLILGGVGVLLLAGGGLWYIQSSRPKQAFPTRRRHSPAAKPLTSEETEGDGEVYCHQCGRRAAADDNFCRACGTPLRRESP